MSESEGKEARTEVDADGPQPDECLTPITNGSYPMILNDFVLKLLLLLTVQ